MLLGEVEVGVGDLAREQQSVVLHAARFPQLLETLRPEHLSEGIGSIDRTVDDGRVQIELSIDTSAAQARELREATALGER